jgi:hypothetical protein
MISGDVENNLNVYHKGTDLIEQPDYTLLRSNSLFERCLSVPLGMLVI